MSSLPIGAHVTVVAGPPVEVQVSLNSTGSSDVRVNTGSSDITGLPDVEVTRIHMSMII